MTGSEFPLHGPEDGPPLILSNALGTTSAVWDAQLPALAAGHPVLTYEPAPRPAVDALAQDVLASKRSAASTSGATWRRSMRLPS